MNKSYLKPNLFKFIPFILLILISCNEDSSTVNPEKKIYNARTFGEYPIIDENVLVVKNYIGSIIINGEGTTHPAARWFIDKNVEAESVEQANSYFALINLSFEKQSDTLLVILNAPGELPLRGMLELDIPYYVTCRIEQVSDNIYVSNLSTPLFAYNASNVQVIKHNGSCEISSGAGNISVEAVLPENGFCRLSLNSGNILISIPSTTSATVYAKSITGSVSQGGLTFTDIRQTAGFISGKLGSGAGEIRAEVNEGTIRLKGF
jgi:hypothetical protein